MWGKVVSHNERKTKDTCEGRLLVGLNDKEKEESCMWWNEV
jgi:hypothetical protein